MIVPRPRSVFHFVNRRILMTHFVYQRCRYLVDRALELLRRHIQFVFAVVVGVFTPDFALRPPAVCFVTLVRLHGDYRLYKLLAEQFGVYVVV